jgi:predicted nucleic acid-binding protein
MRKLLVDTNILLDVLAMRKPFYDKAARLFLMAEKSFIELSVSALSIVNTHYVLKKQLSELETRKIIRDMRLLIKVLPLDQRVTDLAINSGFDDFEDAIQYHTALESGQDIIVTRNLNDFKLSKLPVLTAGQFLGLKD